jgi:hypothetical protein
MHVLQVLISTLWIYYEPLVYYGIIPLSSNIDSKLFSNWCFYFNSMCRPNKYLFSVYCVPDSVAGMLNYT